MTAPVQTQAEQLASNRAMTSAQTPTASLAVPPTLNFLNIKRSHLDTTVSFDVPGVADYEVIVLV